MVRLASLRSQVGKRRLLLSLTGTGPQRKEVLRDHDSVSAAHNLLEFKAGLQLTLSGSRSQALRIPHHYVASG